MNLDPSPLLSDKYWDCDCDEHYIQRNTMAMCTVCGALRKEMPDSRQNEVDEGTHFSIY